MGLHRGEETLYYWEMNYFSICAIVKNEQPYLNDWLLYHIKIGCERFYLYLNDDVPRNNWYCPSDPNFIDSYRWPGAVKQPAVYQHCLDTYKDETRWLAFIDVDEYLVPHTTNDMRAFLKDYEKHPCLAVHWYLFGSNGHKEYEDKPVVERFTRRQATVNDHVKCIVDPSRTLKYHTPHSFVTHGMPVDENHNPIGLCQPIVPNGTCNKIQLNHYATKSRQESDERRARPRADNGQNRPDLDEFFRLHDYNEVEDTRALQLWNTFLLTRNE